jgi:hypothetical protein
VMKSSRGTKQASKTLLICWPGSSAFLNVMIWKSVASRMVSLSGVAMPIALRKNGALELRGRAWQEDGSLSARYWSEAVKERKEPPGVFYYWKGERPRDPNAPQLDGTGEILLESVDRGAGYFITRSDASVTARTAGVFWRADPEDMGILDGHDDRRRADLIAERLTRWRSIANA